MVYILANGPLNCVNMSVCILLWSLTKQIKKLLEVFEMCAWRRMPKIIWMKKLTNEEVLVQAKKTSSMLKTVWHRKLGRGLRHKRKLSPRDNRMENDRQGYLGRKRMELLHNLMEGTDYGQLKDLVSDRSRWRQDSM